MAMGVRQLAQQTFEQFALSDPKRKWEMHGGRLREKPGMTWAHGQVEVLLAYQLLQQLDPKQFRVGVDHGRVHTEQTYYIPDVIVVPSAYSLPIRERQDVLEVYDQPLPLIVEVWSPSTGDYDIDAKLPGYQRRGDLEIWRVHPYERSVITWRRQPDGSYTEATYGGGKVEVSSLPGVTIDLDQLFARV
jgi:Uma2 family endonuclease